MKCPCGRDPVSFHSLNGKRLALCEECNATLHLLQHNSVGAPARSALSTISDEAWAFIVKTAPRYTFGDLPLSDSEKHPDTNTQHRGEFYRLVDYPLTDEYELIPPSITDEE